MFFVKNVLTNAICRVILILQLTINVKDFTKTLGGN